MIYEGRAISLNMIFSTTFEWLGEGAESVKSGTREVSWDITVAQEDWIILGRKKGHYKATVSLQSYFSTIELRIAEITGKPGNRPCPRKIG